MALPILTNDFFESKLGAQQELPEKVLQFGTGVLLRGLPDYFIYKANQQGVFNGKIVVVKSTDSAGLNEFDQQKNLYTHCIRGVYSGDHIDISLINNSIKSVLSAKQSWQDIIALAQSPQLEIIISNTTEAGLVLDTNDLITNEPPHSFPGKLLALLVERWKFFEGDTTKGWVILPTELIPDNGKSLKEILITLSKINQLSDAFIEWLITANDFCNTLVDRIVPGKPDEKELKDLELKLGYSDSLLISSEPSALWAIETNKAATKEKLSFALIDDSVVIAPSIVKYRELKLRLLNGTHTFCCAVALLAGFETVIEAMRDADFKKFIENLLNQELIPSIVSETITHEEATKFANNVLERFANPYILHKWTSISMNFEEKMKMRNAYLIDQYAKINAAPSKYMALGFAAFCCYMKINANKHIHYSEYFTDNLFKTQVENGIAAITEKGIKSCLAL